MNSEPPEKNAAFTISSIAVKTIVIYAVILGATAALYFLYSIKAILLDLVIALIIAVAVDPLVQLLKRYKFSQTWAAFVSLVGVLVLLVAIIGAIASPLFTQGARLVGNAPMIVQEIFQNPTLAALDNKFHFVPQIKSFFSQLPVQLAGVGLPAIGIISNVVDEGIEFIVIFVLAFFLLVEGPDAWERSIKLLRDDHATMVRHTSKRMAHAVSGFVSGNLFISVIAGVVSLIVLLICRVPYAFALSALVALFDLIPLIGTAIATIVVGLVALTKGFFIALIVVVILLVYQFLEGHVIQPIVYSRAISLSPLLIILASIIGAALGGVIGVLLAIPVAAVIQIAIVDIIAASPY